MAGLELLDFQRCAADKMVTTALEYFVAGPDRLGGRQVPFVGQLRAVTGAGKTPILANVVGRLGPAIILWTTKFGSVVDQTVTNLRVGGKYNHLLGTGAIDVMKLSEIPSYSAWRRIIESTDGLTVLVSTVAAWNASEKDDRLNVHRVDPNGDWGDKSRWDQLKEDRQRPLWVVYDEAHNTTTEQVDLLDDLGPSGFFVASASAIKGRLSEYVRLLDEEQRRKRLVPVSTRAVVDAQLLKSTLSVADYDSSFEEMLGAAATQRAELETKLAAMGEPITPKSIYVVETSNVTVKAAEPRPIAIWKELVNGQGIPPSAIAVCTNTKSLPKDAVRVDRLDQLTDQHLHIIFNKRLQEGWDDPSVYVCYFDGKTDSATRIQQVLGRALRQPNGHHLPDEDLNTAYFFVNCPNEALDHITDQLKEELRIYKSDDDPEDFEPVQVRQERKALPKIELRPEWAGKLCVPQLQLELPKSDPLGKLVAKQTFDFGEEDRAAPGRALVNIVSVKTGDTMQASRDLLEDMRVRCGVYLQDQIRVLSRYCANSMFPGIFTNSKLDKTACYGSKALGHYHQLAIDVVAEYESRVQLGLLDDPSERNYIVGPYSPIGTVRRDFEHAAHAFYDSKSFNDPELRMAKALDGFADHVWVRNRDKVGYGIPLPIKSGSSSTFYPDFLWWAKGTVWAIDPTGKFILEEKLRTKLLFVPAPLKIALVTQGKLDSNFKKTDDDGWSLLRRRMGLLAPERFDSLDELLKTLEADSDSPTPV